MAELTTIKPMDRVVEILSPAASAHKIGIRVSLLSIEDDRMEKIKRAITNNRLALEARNKHFKAEDIEENTRDLIFAAMTGWEWYNPTGDDPKNIKDWDKKSPEEQADALAHYDPDAMPTFNGEVPDFNKKNIMAVLKQLPWFLSQVNEAIGDTKAFFDDSKTS
jgi:hypothetical protein